MIQIISTRQKKMESRLLKAKTQRSRKRHTFFSRRFTDFSAFYGEGVSLPSSVRDIDTTNTLVRKIYPKYAKVAGFDVYNMKVLDTPVYSQYSRILIAAMGTTSLIDHSVLWFIKEGK